MKHYFTLGQIHTHSINGKTIDRDTVAVLYAPTHKQAREQFFAWTEGKFHNSYSEDQWDEPTMLPYYPKGYVYLNHEEPSQ